MLLTLDDIANIKKTIVEIEAATAIAADCIDRARDCLFAFQESALHDEIRAFYLSADGGVIREKHK